MGNRQERRNEGWHFGYARVVALSSSVLFTLGSCNLSEDSEVPIDASVVVTSPAQPCSSPGSCGMEGTAPDAGHNSDESDTHACETCGDTLSVGLAVPDCTASAGCDAGEWAETTSTEAQPTDPVLVPSTPGTQDPDQETEPACGNSERLCGSTCVDLSDDDNNCGSCGNSCDATQCMECRGGTCQSKCGEFASCGGGACHCVAPAIQSSDGSCKCTELVCDGACVPGWRSETCGSCNTSCNPDNCETCDPFGEGYACRNQCEEGGMVCLGAQGCGCEAPLVWESSLKKCVPPCGDCQTRSATGECVDLCNPCQFCSVQGSSCEPAQDGVPCENECCGDGQVCVSGVGCDTNCPPGQVVCDGICRESGCDKPPPPEPPSNPGDSWGDPHFVTLDGLLYDLQQVGEYVLVTDDGDFIVQTRQEPWGGSSRIIAANTAVAAWVAGDRVSVYQSDWGAAYVNGLRMTLGDVNLKQGGRVWSDQGVIEIAWPGSDRVSVRRTAAGHLDVTVRPLQSRAVRGLLGNFDGDSANDLVARDGEMLTLPASQADLYQRFSDSWRLVQEESLFEYAADQSTQTFVDPNFPYGHALGTSLSPDVYARARSTCIDRGITDPGLLAACILDVGSTGDDSLATIPAKTPDLVFIDASLLRDLDGNLQWDGPDATPPPGINSPSVVRGSFQNAKVGVSLSSTVKSHRSLGVSFDLHVIGPWQAQTFEVDWVFGHRRMTLSSTDVRQSFPDIVGGEHEAGTASVSKDVLSDGSPRRVHHVHFYIDYPEERTSVAPLVFSASNLADGASWAVENLSLELDAKAVDWQPIAASPATCQDLRNSGEESGIHTLYWHDLGRRVELPVYCDMRDTDGWTLVFKKSTGVETEPANVWSQAPVNEFNQALLDLNQAPLDYANSLPARAWSHFNQARVEVLEGGEAVRTLVFDTQGTTFMNWFSATQWRQAPWTDLPTMANYEQSGVGRYFSINGYDQSRTWYINWNFPGCSGDQVWMMLSTTNICSAWETPFAVQYSALDVRAVGAQLDAFRTADALAVFLGTKPLAVSQPGLSKSP